MPKSSGGCQTCKIRRIKCDEAKPTCGRCRKSKRICLETSPIKQASFSIQDENTYASGITKRPRGPRSSLTALRPQFDLQTKALAYYLQTHLQTVDGFNDDIRDPSGLPGCVLAWERSGNIDHKVDLALSSMALAVFSQTHHHPPAAREASTRYSRLLRIARDELTQIGLPSSSQIQIDACLLAIFLMSRYEGVIHDAYSVSLKTSFASLQSWYHHDGAKAILKRLRGNFAADGITTPVVKHTRKGIIRSSLLRDQKVPDWLSDGADFGEFGSGLEFDKLRVETVNLHFEANSLRAQGIVDASRAEEIIDKVRNLDDALEHWADQNLDPSSVEQYDLPEIGSWPRRFFYSPKVLSFDRPANAALWCQYYAWRMLLNSIPAKCPNTDNSPPWCVSEYDRYQQQCAARSKRMADQLAASIPFCLEKFKLADADDDDENESTPRTTMGAANDIKPHLSNLVVWPLTLGAGIEVIDIAQRTWFRSELAHVGRGIGDNILSRADSDEWAML